MEAIEIKTIGKTLPLPPFIVEPWLREIEKHTNGRVKFAYYSNELIKKGTDLLAVVLNGAIDLNGFMTSYHSDDFPLSGILGMPFLYPSGEVAAAVGWELLEKYMLDTEYKGVKPLWLFVPGIHDFHFASRPVHKLEDLKYMKINIHGVVPASTFRALGGIPVETEGGEMMPFMERGLLDGIVQPWVSPLEFEKVTKYSIGDLNIWTTGMPFIMNLKTWNSLPPDIQKVFEDASGLKKSREVGAAFDKGDRERFEKAKKEGKREIYYLPEDERARWVKAVQPVVTEWINTMEAKGLPGKAIVEDARKLVKKYSK